MQETRIKPNTIVYSAAISACGSAGQWRTALQLFDEMEQNRIEQNTITYNAAIQVRNQQSLVIYMEHNHIEHNHIQKRPCRCALPVRACKGRPRAPPAKAPAAPCPRDPRTGHVTLAYGRAQACERGGEWREAIRVFEKMRAVDVPRDTITYNALVRACEKGGQWQQAFDFMRQMEMN